MSASNGRGFNKHRFQGFCKFAIDEDQRRTLALEDSAVASVKISRSEVRRWMLRALPVWWSRAAVREVAAAATS